jgi:hypothetical protein
MLIIAIFDCWINQCYEGWGKWAGLVLARKKMTTQRAKFLGKGSGIVYLFNREGTPIASGLHASREGPNNIK